MSLELINIYLVESWPWDYYSLFISSKKIYLINL